MVYQIEFSGVFKCINRKPFAKLFCQHFGQILYDLLSILCPALSLLLFFYNPSAQRVESHDLYQINLLHCYMAGILDQLDGISAKNVHSRFNKIFIHRNEMPIHIQSLTMTLSIYHKGYYMKRLFYGNRSFCFIYIFILSSSP